MSTDGNFNDEVDENEWKESDIGVEMRDEEMSQDEREIVDNVPNIMKERHFGGVKGLKRVNRGKLNEATRKVNNELWIDQLSSDLYRTENGTGNK